MSSNSQVTASNAAASSDALLQQLSSWLRPILPELSVGLVLGVAAGYAVKQLGRWLLLVVGLLFIGLQLLANLHIVTINWLRIEQLGDPWVKDGGQKLLHTLSALLARDLPFGGSFAAGLLLGLRLRG